MSARKGVPQFRPTRLLDETPWQHLANCRDANPRIFFDPDRYAEALLVCADCPVKNPCLGSQRGAEGVWAGQVFKGVKPRTRRARS